MRKLCSKTFTLYRSAIYVPLALAVVFVGVVFWTAAPVQSAPGDWPWANDIQVTSYANEDRAHLVAATDDSTIAMFFVGSGIFRVQKIVNTDGSQPWGAAGVRVDGRWDWFWDLAPDINGGVYVSGGLKFSNAFVKHFDSNGTELWSREFTGSGSLEPMKYFGLLPFGGDVIHFNFSSNWQIRRLNGSTGASVWSSPVQVPNCQNTQEVAAGLSGNGTILFGCSEGYPSTFSVREYDGDGNLLNTFSMPDSVKPASGDFWYRNLYPTADGGFLISYRDDTGDHTTKVTSAFTEDWTIATVTDQEPVVSDDGLRFFTVDEDISWLPQITTVKGYDTSTGTEVWSQTPRTIMKGCSFCPVFNMFTDPGGVHVWFDNRYITNNYGYVKFDNDGNYLVGAQDAPVGVSQTFISGAFGSPLLQVGVPDGKGGAVFMWKDNAGGHDRMEANRVEGPLLPAPPTSPPPPPPVPPVPDTSIKRLSIYDGIAWIVGGAPDFNYMQIGNAGRDIFSTSRINFRPDASADGGAFFEGVANTAAQRLELNAGTAGFSALDARSDGPPAVLAVQDDPSGWAGYFLGNVYVSGDVTVIGGVKPAVVQTSRGRVPVISVESPESRFADYGRGRLEGGEAEIVLDATFREVIAESADYHITLTAIGKPVELFVAAQDSTGFRVRGSDDVEFAYEVVASRRGYEEMRFGNGP